MTNKYALFSTANIYNQQDYQCSPLSQAFENAMWFLFIIYLLKLRCTFMVSNMYCIYIANKCNQQVIKRLPHSTFREMSTVTSDTTKRPTAMISYSLVIHQSPQELILSEAWAIGEAKDSRKRADKAMGCLLLSTESFKVKHHAHRLDSDK